MEKNVAVWDRATRAIIGLILIYLAFTNGGLWWILGIIGLVLIGTAITGFCLLYKLVGFRTG
ncbi:MAG: YgaP family membrane protein [Thermocrinis sp.]|uniref:YgaP family membrane protein n=1 Tax=Thermocrinis sp. TaxID=2024383 RepID=UPI003C0121DE